MVAHKCRPRPQGLTPQSTQRVPHGPLRRRLSASAEPSPHLGLPTGSPEGGFRSETCQKARIDAIYKGDYQKVRPYVDAVNRLKTYYRKLVSSAGFLRSSETLPPESHAFKGWDTKATREQKLRLWYWLLPSLRRKPNTSFDWINPERTAVVETEPRRHFSNSAFSPAITSLKTVRQEIEVSPFLGLLRRVLSKSLWPGDLLDLAQS